MRMKSSATCWAVIRARSMRETPFCYRMTFLMSRETLPSSAWRNSTAESSERISVGIFTSMPLVV